MLSLNSKGRASTSVRKSAALVTFERDVHLDDELDFDWMRNEVGQYSEAFVVGALKGLCALNKFECRIHGVDDQAEKKND